MSAGASSSSRLNALTIPELLSGCVAQWPDRELLVFGDKRLTYADAEKRSRTLAGKLLAAGLGKGSRVALLFPNSPEYVISFLAITRIGATAVPVSTFSTANELQQQLCHADVNAVISATAYLNHDYVERFQEAFPAITAGQPYWLEEAPYLRKLWLWSEDVPTWADSALTEDEALFAEFVSAAEQKVCAADMGAMIYTSGSTGEPKGVVHSQGNLLRQSIKQALDNNYGDGDRIFSSMPFFWVGGLTYKLLPVMQSGATLLGCESGAASDMLDFIEREKVTMFLGWPYSARALLADPGFGERDLSAMRGGNLYDALPPEKRPEDPSLVISGLGMTETAGPHTAGQRQWVDETLRDSVGWAAAGMEHRVVDPANGEDLPDGEMGELWVRGDTLMLGLYKQERADTFTNEGWYRTRDLVVRRDGHFFFEGRLDDMVKIKGANVSPREVELALMELDNVVHVAVTGVGSGEQKRLAAVLLYVGDEPSADSVRDFLRQRLSSYKVPSVFRMLPASQIPMRSSGKVDRRALVDALEEQAAAQAS